MHLKALPAISGSTGCFQCKQAVEKKLDEAQNDVLDQPLSHRAKGAQSRKAASSADEPAKSVKEASTELGDPDAALAEKFL